jgi:hypothetical protein
MEVSAMLNTKRLPFKKRLSQLAADADPEDPKNADFSDDAVSPALSTVSTASTNVRHFSPVLTSRRGIDPPTCLQLDREDRSQTTNSNANIEPVQRSAARELLAQRLRMRADMSKEKCIDTDEAAIVLASFSDTEQKSGKKARAVVPKRSAEEGLRPIGNDGTVLEAIRRYSEDGLSGHSKRQAVSRTSQD